MENEVFKTIDWLPGYEIGDRGSVFSLKSEIFMKPVLTRKGY